jgi:hypothetical protein
VSVDYRLAGQHWLPAFFKVLRMNILSLSLAALLLPIAVQAAVTVDEFATGRIYSSVNNDGVSVFTDIEPEELHALSDSNTLLAAQNVLPRGKVVNVNATAIRHSANPAISAPESLSPPDHAAEGIPPELRDGGPPPEDH